MNNAPAPSDKPSIPGHELIRCIGAGSYGEVWMARNNWGKLRAVKVIRRETFGGNLRHFEREYDGIRHYEEVSHTHSSLMPIHQAGIDERAGFFYYVMELADNSDGSRSEDGGAYEAKTLELVLGAGGSRLRVPPADCVRIGMDLATGLEQLHRSGLVHRDIKPANIIFVRDVAKLADIGLVAESGRAVTFVGTEGFIAPEGPGREPADIYALGKVLYEMATGRDRLDYPSLPNMDGLAEPEKEQLRQINAVILKACAFDQASRHESAQDLREELDRVRVGQSIERIRTIERRFGQLKRAAVWIGVLAFVGVLAALWQELAREQGRTNAHTRERLFLKAKLAGGDQRVSGWTTNSLAWVREGANIQPGDDVRDVAAMTLAGIEATFLFEEPAAAASSLAWDSRGQNLLVGGYADNRGQGATRVIALGANTAIRKSLTNSGPVAWLDGQPVQLWRVRGRGGGAALEVAEILEQASPRGIPIPQGAGKDSAVLAISEDGSRAAGEFRDSDETRVVVWDTKAGLMLGQTNLSPTAMAFTPDGRFIAVGLDRGRVRVFETRTLLEVATFGAEDTPITALAFQKDTTRNANDEFETNWRLAAGDKGSVIHVWDLFRRRLIARLRGSYLEIRVLAFSPDGTLLASGGRSHGRIWDVANERQILELDFDMDVLQALAFSPDGTRLAGGNGSAQRRVDTWVMELSHHRGLQTLYGLNNRVEHVWLSNDGRFIAALSHNWQLAVWEVSTGRLLHLFTGMDGSYVDNTAAAFHPSGHLYFSSGRTAHVWDLATGREVESVAMEPGLSDKFRAAPDGRLWLLRCEEVPGRPGHAWVIRDVRNPSPNRPVHLQLDRDWSAYSSDLAPDAKSFVVTGHPGPTSNQQELLVVYDTATGRERWRTNRPAVGHTLPTFSWNGQAVAFAADGQTLAWLSLVDGHRVDVGPFDLSTDRFIVHVPIEGGVVLTRNDESRSRLALGGQFGPITGRAFSKDGQLLAWGTSQGIVLVAHLEEIQRRLKEMGLAW